jgi:transposase
MPASRLLMRKIRDVLRLKHERGLSHRAVAQACAIGVGTVTLYLRRAAAMGLGWPLPAELDDAALEARLFPRAAPARGRIRPDCAWIHRELTRVGVTLQLLWQEYLATYPDGYRYTQFCVIYHRWARTLRPSMRQVHRAGEKTFLDFSGKKPAIVDRRTGELQPVELFVAVLGASSFTYAEATRSQQLPDWIGAHTRMVEYFGGATALWVPDQLKSAITRPSRYEPGINRTYAELATHYGAVVVPARPGKPKDKAKVESAVLVAQRWILARLRDETFFSLADLNAAIWGLLDELNVRPLQQLRVSRRALYEQLDRPALRPLPPSRYVLAEWTPCRVNIDYHVQVAHQLYSVPYALIHEVVEVRATTTTVEMYFKGRRITSHRRRSDGQPSTKVEHMPRAHRAHAEWTPSRLIRWAEKTGPATGHLVPGADALGPAVRGRPARSRECARHGARVVSLSHRHEHPRRRAGPPPARGVSRAAAAHAHARQYPRGRLLRPA